MSFQPEEVDEDLRPKWKLYMNGFLKRAEERED